MITYTLERLPILKLEILSFLPTIDETTIMHCNLADSLEETLFEVKFSLGDFLCFYI